LPNRLERPPAGLTDEWNHPAFFDYCDRWMTQDESAAVAAYIARYGNDGAIGFSQQTTGSAFVDNMWDAYRN
jgi:hypothetical protein